MDGLEEAVKGCDESVDVVSAVVCETSGNLQNTNDSSSDDHSASVSPAVAAATVYRDQLALGDPPTSLIDVASHASTYQGAVDCRADQHGRSTTHELDSPRAQDACGGASSGARAVREEQEEPLSFAHDDHRSEQGQEGEERDPTAACLADLASAPVRQRDHGPADDQRPAGHLRSGPSNRNRSCGLRGSCGKVLRGPLPGGEGVHDLGPDYCQGRSQELQPQAVAPGQLAVPAEPEQSEHGGAGSLLPQHVASGPDLPEDRSWADISRLHAESVRLRRPHDPDDAAADAHSCLPERGGPEPQGGETPQEGGQGSERGYFGQLRGDASVSGLVSSAFRPPDTEVVSNTPESHAGCCTKKLPKGLGRFLGSASEGMLTDTLQGLALQDRVSLLEIACSQDSIISKTMHDMTGSEKSAVRLSLWNNHDLSTNDGVRRVLDQIDTLKPAHVWLSMECGPYSVMQNINQRTPEQKEQLEQKRREVLKQYVGGAIVYCYCIQKGIHATWEWSQSCQAWRLPLVQNIAKKYQVLFAIIRGCQVNLRDPKGRYISKGCKIMTTNKLMAMRMSLPCTCDPRVEHVACEGSLTRKSAFYTKEFAKRVCEVILQGHTPKQIRDEFQGNHHEGDLFGKGTFCICEDHKHHGMSLQCGSCRLPVEQLTGLGLAAEDQGSCNMSKEEIQRRLYLLHAATGHSPVRYLVQSLKKRGVHPDIIKEAERFTCTVCAEKCRPQPRNVAALEPQPQRFDVVTADMGHFIQPHTGEHFQFLLMVDEGSRFKVGRVVLTGKKKHISAAIFIKTLKESWISYFGCPKTLRLDPDGAFRSHELSEFCDQHHIYLDLVPSEGHWKLGVCERAVQSTKSMLEKVFHEHPETTPEEALSECVRALNCREIIRGYSPMQHVLGKSLDETDRIFNPQMVQSPELTYDNPTAVHHKTEALRLSAEKGFLEWNAKDRLMRATHSRHRRVLNFSAGDLVYIWRKQVTGEDTKPGNNTRGRFVGPARILATEQKRDEQGHLTAGSSVWLVRGRRLLKCCPEQLRHASDREKILEELHAPDPQPWSFPCIADELGGNEYEDWSEQPMELEWKRAADPEQEWQPTLRQRGKKMKPLQYGDAEDLDQGHGQPDTGGAESSKISGPRARQRSRSPVRGDVTYKMPEGFQAAPHWGAQLPDHAFLSQEEPSIWKQDTAVQVEIDMPENRNASEKALKSLQSYFAASLKRKTIEVSEKRLTPEERLAFQGAKQVEVTNFIAAKAFEALPPGYKASRSDAVKMRWILTWKTLPCGGRKAKARAVLLGYMDPSYSERATTSPTTTRQTRQIQLSTAAAKNSQEPSCNQEITQTLCCAYHALKSWRQWDFHQNPWPWFEEPVMGWLMHLWSCIGQSAPIWLKAMLVRPLLLDALWKRKAPWNCLRPCWRFLVFWGWA